MMGLVLLLGTGLLWCTVTPAQAAETPLSLHRGGVLPGAGRGTRDEAGIRTRDTITYFIFLPVIAVQPVYNTVAVITPAPPTDPSAANHPDKNLALRGYITTTAYLGLVDIPTTPDLAAPQLAGLFADNRVPTFTHAYQVYDWDWTCNCRGAPLNDYGASLIGMAVTPGEVIQAPGSGYDIGWMPTGYEVMVLYAGSNRLTLKYTRDDDVIVGYTLHIENISIDPGLQALYDSTNASGRVRLPALFAKQGMGRAAGNEIKVAIRDTGSFMDPRSRGDWWQGR